jgi:hypothetical protein
LLLAGPFMGWLFFIGAFRYQSKDFLERALKFSAIGIYLFFLISTFKGRVEANWTVPAIIPLIILSHQYFYDDKKWQRILIFTVPFTLLAVFFIRIYLVADNKFLTILNTNEFEQNKTWAKKIHKISEGLPVVFINSYQKASKYWFYSGIPSFSLNTPDYRRNNYNYWPLEKSMQSKEVYVMSVNDPIFFPDSIKTSAGILRGKKIDSFYSHSDIRLIANDELMFNKEKKIIVNLSVTNNPTIKLDSTLQLHLFIFNQNQFIASYPLLPGSIDPVKNINILITSAPVMLPKGNYFARIAVSSVLPGYPSLNSTNLKLSAK